MKHIVSESLKQIIMMKYMGYKYEAMNRIELNWLLEREGGSEDQPQFYRTHC